MIVRRLFVAALAAVFLSSCDQLQQFTGSAAPVRDDGAYVVLEVDTGALQRQQLALVADRMAEALRAATPIVRYTGRGVVGDAARIRLIDTADHARALAALAALGPDFIISDKRRRCDRGTHDAGSDQSRR